MTQYAPRGPQYPWHPEHNPGGFSDLPPRKSLMIHMPSHGGRALTWPPDRVGTDGWGRREIHQLEPVGMGDGRAFWYPTNKGVQRVVDDETLRLLLRDQVEEWAHPDYTDWRRGGYEAHPDDFEARWGHALRQLTPLELFRSGLVDPPPGADAPHDDWVARLTFADWLQDNDWNFINPEYSGFDSDMMDGLGMANHERRVAERIRNRLEKETRGPPYPPPQPDHNDPEYLRGLNREASLDRTGNNPHRPPGEGGRPFGYAIQEIPVNYADEAGLASMPAQLREPRPSDSADYPTKLSHLSDWWERATRHAMGTGQARDGEHGVEVSGAHPLGVFQSTWGEPWGTLLRGYGHDEFRDDDVWNGDMNSAIDFTHQNPMPSWEEFAAGAADSPPADAPEGDADVWTPDPDMDPRRAHEDYARQDYAFVPGGPAPGDFNDPDAITDVVLAFYAAGAINPDLADQLIAQFGHPDQWMTAGMTTATREAVEEFTANAFDQTYPHIQDENFWLDGADDLGDSDVPYSATPYLAHPGRPDSHLHPASGFRPGNISSGFFFLDDPNGLRTEIMDSGGDAWDADVFVPGHWGDALHKIRAEPDPTKVYADLLRGGGVSRVDVPPPRFEDLDLHSATEQPTPYLEHWSKPNALFDHTYNWQHFVHNPNLLSTVTPGGLRTNVVWQHGGNKFKARVLDDSLRHTTEDDELLHTDWMGSHDLHDLLRREGALPVSPVRWDQITSDLNPDPDAVPQDQVYPLPDRYAAMNYDLLPWETDGPPEGFEQDPVFPPGIFPPESGPPSGFGAGYPPPQPYGRADYLAHPGRPDSHTHPASGFRATPGTFGGTWTNKGTEDSGITTEVSQVGGGWKSTDPGNWGYTSSMVDDEGRWGILDEQELFPTKEELYRHLLAAGVISRADVPGPNFEDIDLDSIRMSRYADLDPFTGFPTTPGAPQPSYRAPRMPGVYPPPEEDFTPWDRSVLGNSFFPRTADDESFRLGWDRTGVNPNALHRPQSQLPTPAVPVPPPPRPTGRPPTPTHPSQAPTTRPFTRNSLYADYHYTGYDGFDQDGPYSNPVAGQPQAQPGQQQGIYPYPGPPPAQGQPGQFPGQQQPQGMLQPSMMPGQPQAGQEMMMPAGAPTANPASVNPPGAQPSAPPMPPAPSFDQNGQPLPQMYDETCYGPDEGCDEVESGGWGRMMNTPEDFEAAIAENPWDGTGHAVFADWLEEQGMAEEADIRRLFGRYVTKNYGTEAQQGSSFDVPALLELFRSMYADARRRGWLQRPEERDPVGYADDPGVGPVAAQTFDEPFGTYTYPGDPNQGMF